MKIRILKSNRISPIYKLQRKFLWCWFDVTLTGNFAFLSLTEVATFSMLSNAREFKRQLELNEPCPTAWTVLEE